MVTAISEQAVVTDWPTRLLLTGATLAVIVLALLLLRRGWRRRAKRQEWAPLPEVTQSPSLANAVTGNRDGEPILFLPAAQLEAVETAPGMLQKVFGGHGIVAITWTWGQSKVVTGIWFADPADQKLVIDWIEDYLVKPPEAPAQGEGSQ